MKTYLDIFIAFFRSSMLGYGGGPSTIPLVHKEVVHRFQWMNDEEFSDVLALGNALPGPINTKMAGYIGYRIKGWWGCTIAIIATAIPTVLLMIFLLGFLTTFKDSSRVQGMTGAVRPVVGVMLAVLAYDFFKKSWVGQEKNAKMTNALIAVISLLVIVFLHLHPAIVIGGLLLFALFKDKKES